jgi:hypothetical protein
MTTLISLRGLFEPYNFQREIIGFDTFDGFTDIHKNDENKHIKWEAGDYKTPTGYAEKLKEILEIQERMSPSLIFKNLTWLLETQQKLSQNG